MTIDNEIAKESPSTTNDQKRVAHRLLGAINSFRQATNDPVIPANQIAVLLYVAQAEEAPSVVDLCRAIGFSDAAGSRTVQILGRGRRGEEGADLLEAKEDPLNYSRKRIYLTAKGVKLIERLENQFPSKQPKTIGRKRFCPVCGTLTALPIEYGYPTSMAFERAENEEVILGGCCLDTQSPNWACTTCWQSWRTISEGPNAAKSEVDYTPALDINPVR